jgi:diguanylate cyclase (GGDEF)-like protein/PAS domain S-box-containing protein
MTMNEMNSLRILLVEDDEHDRLAFHRSFRMSEVACEIIECMGAPEALALVTDDSARFDVVVIDHHLPRVYGLDLCKQLLDSRVNIPLVILTGSGSEQVAVDALKAGVNDYIIKDPDSGYLAMLPVLLPEVVRNYGERLARVQAEEEVRESRERLAQIVEGFSVPTFVIDANHTVTHWNRACVSITGVPASEVIGTRNQWRAFYPAERPVMADLIVDGADDEIIARHYGGKFRRSAVIEGAYEAEDFFPHFGEGGKWLYFTAALSMDSEGKVIGAIETLQDITERKRAEEALKESEHRYYELSITDSLTGLYNSRHFYGQIQQEMERAQRYQRPLSLLLLDVDDFKRFNDTFGHLEGDRVLSGLAQVIRNCIRLADSAYRYGGEEFVVILPETDSEEALHVAERLRSSFELMTFCPQGNGDVNLTISIGVSRFQAEDNVKSFVRRADEGTYAAKRQGKNRVMFSGGNVQD